MASDQGSTASVEKSMQLIETDSKKEFSISRLCLVLHFFNTNGLWLDSYQILVKSFQELICYDLE